MQKILAVYLNPNLSSIEGFTTERLTPVTTGTQCAVTLTLEVV